MDIVSDLGVTNPFLPQQSLGPVLLSAGHLQTQDTVPHFTEGVGVREERMFQKHIPDGCS